MQDETRMIKFWDLMRLILESLRYLIWLTNTVPDDGLELNPTPIGKIPLVGVG